MGCFCCVKRTTFRAFIGRRTTSTKDKVLARPFTAGYSFLYLPVDSNELRVREDIFQTVFKDVAKDEGLAMRVTVRQQFWRESGNIPITINTHDSQRSIRSGPDWLSEMLDIVDKRIYLAHKWWIQARISEHKDTLKKLFVPLPIFWCV